VPRQLHLVRSHKRTQFQAPSRGRCRQTLAEHVVEVLSERHWSSAQKGSMGVQPNHLFGGLWGACCSAPTLSSQQEAGPLGRQSQLYPGPMLHLPTKHSSLGSADHHFGIFHGSRKVIRILAFPHIPVVGNMALDFCLDWPNGFLGPQICYRTLGSSAPESGCISPLPI
jgi:hypothetical protein